MQDVRQRANVKYQVFRESDLTEAPVKEEKLVEERHFRRMLQRARQGSPEQYAMSRYYMILPGEIGVLNLIWTGMTYSRCPL